MNYNKKEIKQGVNLHTIKTKNFKTNLLAVFLTTPLDREYVTKNTILNMVLRRGSKTMPTQEEISKVLENMYGATFDCGIEKTGDNHIIKFYLESLNDEFLPQNEDVLKQSIETLINIVLDPYIEKDGFKLEYVEGEKENLKQIINGRKDNKQSYAISRCVEEMYKEEPYGLYKYGYVEDLKDITKEDLYQYYLKLIKECKIDIFISGDIGEGQVEQILNENENIKQLINRQPKYIINSEKKENEQRKEPKEIIETMDVSQGNLVIGLDIKGCSKDSKYVALLYNAILGGTPTSKLFQNVREKESLAYVTGSSYIRQKDNIFIRCGIETKNYEKALEVTKEQIEDMKKGDFTEEDIQNSRNSIISMIEGIPEEQDTEIAFYLGQELSDSFINIESYIEEMKRITKEEIVDIANKIEINTIYLLRN